MSACTIRSLCTSIEVLFFATYRDAAITIHGREAFLIKGLDPWWLRWLASVVDAAVFVYKSRATVCFRGQSLVHHDVVFRHFLPCRAEMGAKTRERVVQWVRVAAVTAGGLLLFLFFFSL